MNYIKLVTLLLITSGSLFGQFKYENQTKYFRCSGKEFQDTTKPKTFTKKTISGIFLGIGGGLSIPMSPLKDNSDVSFGILGRLDFSSTAIFPLVIGGEVTYFNFAGSDQFKTVNTLNTFQTKILSYGLNVEYSLTKIFPSAFTMPFISVDVKSNNIKREMDAGRSLDSLNLPATDSKVSIGAGFGFTMFIFDFHIKYNYMKDASNIGVYTKVKVPVIKF
ncbi:MAG TPA: hypothetical protein VJ455_10175 [Ignavibacteria bacterium]|nr:hypothetical protein [Ignavibacteria bacterium]